MSDLPTREAWKGQPNSAVIGFAIADAYACGDLMTREEFYDSLDVAAAINHLEWLRGLQLTTGSMAEVLSASVDGVWGGEDDE